MKVETLVGYTYDQTTNLDFHNANVCELCPAVIDILKCYLLS